LEQCELIGIRRTTLKDVARRCGVGRATLDRRFPTKTALIEAVVLAEVQRYLHGNSQAYSQCATFEERMINGTIFAMTFMRNHALLNKLMQTEPENVLPSFTVDAAAILELAVNHGAALLRTELFGEIDPRPEQERHLRNVTELYTRLTISFILTPQTGIKLDTTDEIREYAHTYILPMITTASVYPR
jgi:AcrR family transcriptional regulator